MSEQNKIEFEELLNLIVDNEATERQKTEFRRLAKNDPSLEKQLQLLLRQKQLMNALPVETAPQGCVEAVTAVLERKFILNDFDEPERAVSAGGHLLIRRWMTAAAMLLLPLGLLSLVVWQIIKPASQGPLDYVPTGVVLSHDESPDPSPIGPMAVNKMPFDGILTFQTDQQMTISNYVEKVVFDLGLISVTVPSRDVDVTTYQITASPAQVAALLGSLQHVWPYCQQVDLSVADGAEDHTIDIKHVQARQVTSLVMESSSQVLAETALQFARANDHRDAAYARSDTPSAETGIAQDDMPGLPVPILTGRDEHPRPAPPAQSTVRLRIHVKRILR